MRKYKDYINLTIGVLIEALAFVLFFEPNNLCATDVSGLSVIFQKLYNVNVSLFILVGNLALIIISFIFLGKKKTLKTILGSLLLPLFTYILEPITLVFDFSKVEVTILSLFGGILTGIGYGLIFKSGFTSGGTDIIEDIFCHYFNFSLGISVMLVDGFVVLMGGLAFGIEPMLYSMIALVMMSMYSNRKVNGVDEDKVLMITSKNKNKIINFMKKNYQYGITILDGIGKYSNTESDYIMCSVSSKNYYRIKNEIKSFDKSAFIIVLSSYDTSYTDKDIRRKRKKINA